LAPGGIAHHFTDCVQRFTQASVAAVGSRDLGRAEAFAAQYGIPRAYGSYADLVADPDIDAVYIASPHSEHRDHALLALEAGKPVLVEKAFAVNTAQAEEVFAVAQAKNLFAMEAMWARCLPHYGLLRELAESGELGEIRHLSGVHTQSLNLDPAGRMMNPALAGGALLDLGVYPLHAFHMLMGPPDDIAATGILAATGVDRAESIALRWGDALGTAMNDCAAAGRCSFALIGSAGRVDIHDWFYTPQDLVVTPLRGEPRVLAGQVPGGYQYEAAEVARCLDAGLLESPLVTWQDTLDVMRQMDTVRAQLGVVFPQNDSRTIV
jgi:predicted dehydrogenase